MTLRSKTKIYRNQDGRHLIYVPDELRKDSQYPFAGGTVVQMRIHPDRERMIIESIEGGE